jgi:succinate dehydrogenase/fumarate reductase flavoprotein subunit
MPYPELMRKSLLKVEASRRRRIQQIFPRLGTEEKQVLLKKYHPDYLPRGKAVIRIGPNRGEPAPRELVAVLEAPSLLDVDTIDLEQVDYQCDVLVIGGGGAALTAALSAHERGADVIIATKLRLGDSNTIMAEGGIGAATEPEDSPVIHYVDTLVGGRYMNVPDLVEALVMDAPFIVEWLSGLGVNFDRRPDGSYFTHMPGGHSRRRSHSVKDLTGLEIMRVLGDEVRCQKIPILEFCPAVELILDEQGRCAGAVLLNFDTGKYFLVRAQATVLATGGAGRLHPLGFPTSNHYGATADGLVMAYRAGVELLYAGYIQYHPTGTAWPEQMLGLLISEALRAQGAQMVNAEGEIFVDRLETRDALSAAIIRECAGRGKGVTTPTGMTGVWLDTPIIDIMCGEGTFMNRFAGICNRLKKYDIHTIIEPILVYPTQHYQNGGIRIDVHGRTALEGLYAVGEVAGGVHGHNRLGSNSLVDIFVFGRRAGKHAAENLSEPLSAKLTLDHVRKYDQTLQREQIFSKIRGPILLPDYRFEKALTTIEHIKGDLDSP